MRNLITIASLLMLMLIPQAAALEQNSYRLQLGNSQQYRLSATPSALAHPALADKPYAREITAAASQAGLDPALVHALIQVESAYRADAVSEKGARGLMQLMPDTARRFGVADASEPRSNLLAGTRYLRHLLDRYDQRIDLALAAYNAGEGAVAQYAGNIPPYPETQRYVPAVLDRFNEWRSSPPRAIDYSAGTRLTLAPTVSPSKQPAIRYK
jgi:soluble lytic murein transglycosylase-like protein